MTRLLQCHDCRSIEPLPDPPSGLNPRDIQPGQDPLLDELVARHHSDGQAHLGTLHSVNTEDWDDPRREYGKRQEILHQINQRSSGAPTGLPSEAYALKETFAEDALRCFSQHGRPEVCIDWHSDSKKLGRPTPEGKEWQRQNYKAPAVFLCDYCPVRSLVDQRKRDQLLN